jgi:polyvinyl alcohol dehydrogenase (cytochrome)
MKVSAAAAALFVMSCFPVLAQQGGAALYNQHCASCHDAGGDQQSRVPGRNALQSMSFEHVLRIITSGSMAEMAKGRTDDERKAIASFVTGRSSNDTLPTVAGEPSAKCAKNRSRLRGRLTDRDGTAGARV